MIEERVGTLVKDFPWVEMVVLSELALTGHRLANSRTRGEMEPVLGNIARRHGIWFIPGSFHEKVDDRIYNTTPIIDPRGHTVAYYRKMFPFYPYETGVAPGTTPVVFDVPDVGRFGVSICYDMWFPETSRQLIAMGAEVIIHPTLTGTIDRDVELAIVRATAAQNQCFIIDVNGVDAGGVGRSIFVGPAGDVLHQAGSAPEEIPIEIDLDRVRRSREVGLRGLGQPLKSFRDRAFDFPIYQTGARSPHLDGLGRLAMPTRGTRAGLDVPSPQSRNED